MFAYLSVHLCQFVVFVFIVDFQSLFSIVITIFDYNYHDFHALRTVLIQHPSYHEYQTISAGM